MGRKYQRKNRHTRNGKNYTPYNSFTKTDLNTAMEKVKCKEMSIRSAAKHFCIPKSTLARHYHKHEQLQERAGRPTLFTIEEEKVFVDYCLLLAEWGFPLDKLDLRVFAQRYLNKLGKAISNLKENLPGADWAQNFVERHHDKLSNRMAANISSERAKTTAAVVENFFENFSQSVHGVKPENIINFDETNLSDDPGGKNYIFKRGCKYPERIMNNSKSAVSIMCSASASGELLPMYVVYKADHLWDQWMFGGPEHTRYNRSKSGWFDSVCFEDWFFTVVIPYFKNKAGRKVIVGDNLSSHFSENVLKSCQENDIRFVCLPPNSTHLLQPLDVAFFAPMKRYWRSILTHWKATAGRKQKTLTKSEFPKLLSKLHKVITENDIGATNIRSGFEKCGLYPLNPDRPKSRLPGQTSIEDVNNTVSHVVLEILEEIRGGNEPTNKAKRKRRCDVPPGQSITAADLNPKSEGIKSKKKTGKYLKNSMPSKKNTVNPDIEINFYGNLSSDEENQNPILLPKSSPQMVSQNNIRRAKRLKKTRHISSSSEDSIVGSIDMSVHSDSDIIDIPDDDSNITYFEDEDQCEVTRKTIDLEAAIWEEIMIRDQKSCSEEDKDRVDIVCTSNEQEKKTEETEKLREDNDDNSVTKYEEVKKTTETENVRKDTFTNWTIKDKKVKENAETENVMTDFETTKETETKLTKEFKIHSEIDENIVFYVGDSVMVRYYLRKAWKHYVGKIAAVDKLRHIYSIDFYKTIKKGGLKFVAKGSKDKDQVPYPNIVKKIKLVQIKVNPPTYVLDAEDDIKNF